MAKVRQIERVIVATTSVTVSVTRKKLAVSVVH